MKVKSYKIQQVKYYYTIIYQKLTILLRNTYILRVTVQEKVHEIFSSMCDFPCWVISGLSQTYLENSSDFQVFLLHNTDTAILSIWFPSLITCICRSFDDVEKGGIKKQLSRQQAVCVDLLCGSRRFSWTVSFLFSEVDERMTMSQKQRAEEQGSH